MHPDHAPRTQAVLSRLHLSRQHWLLVLLVAAVFTLDQATKYAVAHTLSLGESVPDRGFFRITYTYNTGSAFGLFTGQNTLLILASFLGVGVLTWFYRSHPNPGLLLRFSLGLQLGGALGNLSDRLILGRVTDFIDVGRWPIFNVADSAIVVGIIMLMWLFLKSPARDTTDASPQPFAHAQPQPDPPDDPPT